MTVPPTEPPAAVAASPVAHVVNHFSFVVDAAMDRVAPLFGAQGERAWAGDFWDPQFLYPQPAHDVEGAVFIVQHGGHDSIWVNTVFDPGHGQMQYVAVVPQVMATTIDVTLTPQPANATRVDVTYRRTALTSQANVAIEGLGAKDAACGPEWQSAVSQALTR